MKLSAEIIFVLIVKCLRLAIIFLKNETSKGIQSVNSTNIMRRIVKIIILSNLIKCVF